MTSLEISDVEANGIQIDTAYLLRQVSTLAQVIRQERTWNEFGEKVGRDFRSSTPTLRVVSEEGEVETPVRQSTWTRAKELIHSVLAGREPKYDAIRKRLGNLREPWTPALLSTLSLWLAGVLGISVSATIPMVAAMLYAVAEASGDCEILLSR